MKITDLIQSILTENPHLSNDEVAELVQQKVPGATTSAASVSSVKSGLRKKGLLATAVPIADTAMSFEPQLPEETAEERSDRIRRRYATLERMAHRVAEAKLPALIVSGPPGLGKSYTVEKVLEDRGLTDVSSMDMNDLALMREENGDDQVGEYDTICGTITAVGLYITLWNMRNGGVVVLDDCDDVFRDETCLNLLKAVLDSSETRRVSYRKKAHWMEEMDIPTSFEFKGSIVFCTNIDFEMAIKKGSAMGAHFGALIDRCLYLSLTMRTTDDFLTRIHHVAIEDGMLVRSGLTEDQAQEVFDSWRTT